MADLLKFLLTFSRTPPLLIDSLINRKSKKIKPESLLNERRHVGAKIAVSISIFVTISIPTFAFCLALFLFMFTRRD